MINRILLLLFVLAASATAQTCPPLNLQSTPRIVASDKQVVVTMRQSDGSFMGYFGPRVAPMLLGTSVPNLQNAITSCYPVTNKKGSAPFSSLVRPGWSSYIGDYADLDGDGVLDGVLIAYKPSAVYVVVMAPSNVPKAGYPLNITLPGSPIALRVIDVNKDGRPDLIVSAGPAVTGNPPASIYVLLNNGNGTFQMPPMRFTAGGNPNSFAALDINNDGNIDLLVADKGSDDGTGGGVRILLGDGRGGFSAPSNLQTANTSVTSVVVGDFNGDGRLDIAASTGSTISLFTGTGPGTFNATRATFPSGGDSVYLAMGDFNADGKLDLVSSNYQEQTAAVLLNNGSAAGGFLAPVSYVISRGRQPDFLVVTDFNNDGIPDIIGGLGSPFVIAGNSNNVLDVLLGNGDGTFAAPPTTPVGTTPIAFSLAGDFNNDGKMDVVAMSQRTTSLLFYAGRGDGTFAVPVTTNLGANFGNAIGAIPADFNGDNVPDLAILTTSGFAIALSLKTGSFQPLNQTPYQSALSVGNLAVGDFNGDGRLDIATPICSTNGGPTTIHVYNGSGTGSFTDSQPFRLNYCPSSFVGIDINGDKRADILSLNNNGPSAGAYSSVDVLLNQGQGSFASPRGYGLDPNGIVVMSTLDVNGDGRPDIVAASSFSKPFAITTLLNNGDGTFGSRMFTTLDTPPLAIAGADLNGDKNADLIIVPNQGGPTAATNDMTFAVGNGDGTFQTPVHLAGPNTSGLQFADFNGDGRPDLLASSVPSSPTGYFVVIPTGPPPTAPPAVVTVVNGASFTSGAPVAADSIASAFGSNLAVAGNLAGTTVTIKDSAGTGQTSGTLFFVSPGQVNFQVPPGLANGMATVTVTSGDGTVTSGAFQIANVAPGLFATNASGLYAGSILRVGADGSQTPEENYQLDAGQNVVARPLNIGQDQIFLILYGTGIKHATTVTATVGNQNVPVAYAGAQGAFVSEDQVNVGPLPASLAGTGKANIVITADGVVANTVTLVIQ